MIDHGSMSIRPWRANGLTGVKLMLVGGFTGAGGAIGVGKWTCGFCGWGAMGVLAEYRRKRAVLKSRRNDW